MTRRCVVAGGAGFIGSHLAEGLLAEGCEVVVIDDLSTGHRENLSIAERSARFTLVITDIAGPEARATVQQVRPDTMFLLAAQSSVKVSMRDPMLDVRTNVLGLINMLEAARAANSRVIFATSGGTIYGDVPPQDQPISESVNRAPISIYGVAKSVAVDYLTVYGKQFGVPWSALALGNVYGPRQAGNGESGVVAIYCHRLANGLPLEVFGDGQTTRDFVHVSDVVDAFLRAGTSAVSGVLNIGTGRGTSVNEIVGHFRSLYPKRFDVLHKASLPGEVRAVALDPSKSMRLLGWKPTVGLHAGIAELTSGL